MIKSEEIINRQFSRAFWGYDIREVDEFLDEIIRGNERAEQELEIAQLRIKMLLEELEHYTGKKETAPETAEETEEPLQKEAQAQPEQGDGSATEQKDAQNGAPEGAKK